MLKGGVMNSNEAKVIVESAVYDNWTKDDLEFIIGEAFDLYYRIMSQREHIEGLSVSILTEYAIANLCEFKCRISKADHHVSKQFVIKVIRQMIIKTTTHEKYFSAFCQCVEHQLNGKRTPMKFINETIRCDIFYNARKYASTAMKLPFFNEIEYSHTKLFGDILFGLLLIWVDCDGQRHIKRACTAKSVCNNLAN